MIKKIFLPIFAILIMLFSCVEDNTNNNNNNASATNLKNGLAFLAENAVKEGVIVLPSGLQYRIDREGTGEKPTLYSRVKCHYKGTFINGSVFDSSYARAKAAEFSVKEVIKGWTEVLQLMKVGAIWQVYIPSNLAYGTSGASSIGPNETLIFQIELIDIVE